MELEHDRACVGMKRKEEEWYGRERLRAVEGVEVALRFQKGWRGWRWCRDRVRK